MNIADSLVTVCWILDLASSYDNFHQKYNFWQGFISKQMPILQLAIPPHPCWIPKPAEQKRESRFWIVLTQLTTSDGGGGWRTNWIA